MKNSGSKEEADDIFQDAVVILFNQVLNETLKITDTVEGYIYTVARNLWIDRARKQKRFREYAAQHSTDPEYDASQLDILMDKEKNELMQKVFEELDEKCQSMLRYSIYERLSMKEIAQKMGQKNEKVAKAIHYRCKQYLAKLVKNNPVLMELLGK